MSGRKQSWSCSAVEAIRICPMQEERGEERGRRADSLERRAAIPQTWSSDITEEPGHPRGRTSQRGIKSRLPRKKSRRTTAV